MLNGDERTNITIAVRYLSIKNSNPLDKVCNVIPIPQKRGSKLNVDAGTLTKQDPTDDAG